MSDKVLHELAISMRYLLEAIRTDLETSDYLKGEAVFLLSAYFKEEL